MVEMKKLTVELRSELGKQANRRLRTKGRIPAVLYGHKQNNVILSVPKEEVEAVLRHGNRFVVLAGAVNERAFIKECQWDTWGKVILHVDFSRVSEHEHVQLSVPLEVRGEAPGIKDGGVLKQILHTLEIECEPAAAPEKIGVNVNHLEFEQSIAVKDLALPDGVRSLADPTLIVVECSAPVEMSEEAQDGAEGAAEPEVIGRKKAEEEEEA